MECSTCGHDPCPRSSFCRACRKADLELAARRVNRAPVTINHDVFVESTIDATIHVICHQPKDLAAWLARHPPGLEQVARSRMEGAGRRKKGLVT